PKLAAMMSLSLSWCSHGNCEHKPPPPAPPQPPTHPPGLSVAVATEAETWQNGGQSLESSALLTGLLEPLQSKVLGELSGEGGLETRYDITSPAASHD
ncbi:hypothetical protein KUCAC02_004882, partial [Chaenocephalus aceratus]